METLRRGHLTVVAESWGTGARISAVHWTVQVRTIVISGVRAENRMRKGFEYFLSQHYLLLFEAENPVQDGPGPFFLGSGSQPWLHIEITKGAFYKS